MKISHAYICYSCEEVFEGGEQAVFPRTGW